MNNLPKLVAWKRNGRDSNPRRFESQVQRSNHYTTKPHPCNNRACTVITKWACSCSFKNNISIILVQTSLSSRVHSCQTPVSRHQKHFLQFDGSILFPLTLLSNFCHHCDLLTPFNEWATISRRHAQTSGQGENITSPTARIGWAADASNIHTYTPANYTAAVKYCERTFLAGRFSPAEVVTTQFLPTLVHFLSISWAFACELWRHLATNIKNDCRSERALLSSKSRKARPCRAINTDDIARRSNPLSPNRSRDATSWRTTHKISSNFPHHAGGADGDWPSHSCCSQLFSDPFCVFRHWVPTLFEKAPSRCYNNNNNNNNNQ